MVLIQDNGDHQAFAELYDRYANRLNAFFYRMLWGDGELSQDCVHDVFAKIIQKPERFNPDYDFEPWLFKVAANMCKNIYRKRAFEKAYKEHERNTSSGTEELDDEATDTIVLTDAIHSLLDTMGEERKLIFLLRYQQELSIKELSEMLEVSEGTIKSRLFYTREKIRKTLNY